MIEQVALKLRKALEAENFAAAVPLIEQYGALLKTALKNAENSKACTQTFLECSEFLQDSLHLARVMRSHIGVKQAAANALARYQTASYTATSWRIEG